MSGCAAGGMGRGMGSHAKDLQLHKSHCDARSFGKMAGGNDGGIFASSHATCCTSTPNNLRLWRACPAEEFDFDAFNESKYTEAVEARRRAEDLSAVLYPNDDKYEGKVLRLKQQYFFVSASLQDLLREFLKKPNRKWSEMPDKVSVQMNDTHPTMAVVEMMRLLVDVQQVAWDEAWDLTRKTCNYTNHTVMPEALEKWPVEMMEEYLPRPMPPAAHPLQIICDFGELAQRKSSILMRSMKASTLKLLKRAVEPRISLLFSIPTTTSMKAKSCD
jgi:glucan phosphorylase